MKWSLVVRVYAGLAALLIFSIVLSAVFWDHKWAQEWMPNLIAEWSGLLVAVLIVDRLIERAKEEQLSERQQPLRRLAGYEISRSLIDLVTTAVQVHANHHGLKSGAEEPADVFFERWASGVQAGEEMPIGTHWLEEITECIRAAESGLAMVRRDFDSVLAAAELAPLRDLEKTFEAARLTIEVVMENQNAPPERKAALVGTALTLCSPGVSEVLALRTALTGETLTTSGAWEGIGSRSARTSTAAPPEPGGELP
jgi:hypothetical protein